MSAQLEQEIRQLTNQLQQFMQAQSMLTTETRQMADAQREVNAELELFEDDLGDTHKLTKKQNDLYGKAIASKQKELQIQQKIIAQKQYISDLESKIAAGETNLNENRDRAQDILDRLQNKHNKAIQNTTKAQGLFSKTMTGVPGIINKASGGISSFGMASGIAGTYLTILGKTAKFAYEGLQNYSKSIRNISKFNAGVVEGIDYGKGLSDIIRTSFKLGMDPEMYAKMSAEARQSTNALGGFKNALNVTQQLASDLSPLTGDINEARLEAIRMFHSLATKGIYPTTKALQQYKEDIYTQSEITGMGIEETKSLFEGLANDADTIGLLRSVRLDEREALLANQRALLMANEALGMLPAQAMAAGKSLNQLMIAKPQERFAKAARVQAFAGALGLGAEGRAFATEMYKPRGKGSEAAASRALTTLTNAADSMAGSGIQNEFLVSSLMDSLKVESEFGPNSPFSTTLGNVVAKPINEIKDMYAEGQRTATNQMNNQLQILDEQLTALKKGIIITDFILEAFDNLYWPIKETLSMLGNSIMNIGDVILNSFDIFKNIGSIILNGMGEGLATILRDIARFIGLDSFADTMDKNITNMKGITAQSKDSLAKLTDIDRQQYYEPNKPKTIEPSATSPVKEQTTEVNKRTRAQDATTQLASSSAGLLELSENHGVKLDSQISQLNQSNSYLKTIAEGTPVLVDLAQKQLAAMTMSETQRSKYMSQLSRSNSNLAAEYATIN